MSYEGKNIVITGGCAGIGLSAAKQFLSLGAQNVALLDLVDTNEVVKSLSATFKSQKIVFVKTDVTKKDQVVKAFAEVVSQFKHLDIVLCNAGIFNEHNEELTINVNLFGVVNTTYAAIDILSKSTGGNGGVIAVVSSVAGLDGIFSGPVYSATKHGVIGFFRCLSHEFYYQKHGISFITLCPGFTDTILYRKIGDNVATPDIQETQKNLETDHGVQTSEEVAKSFSDIISLAKNGSIWKVVLGQHKEVQLTKYWDV